jgi:hypothetical protein
MHALGNKIVSDINTVFPENTMPSGQREFYFHEFVNILPVTTFFWLSPPYY